MAEIRVFGAPWCPDCKRSKKFLAEHRVPYDWIDIDQDPVPPEWWRTLAVVGGAASLTFMVVFFRPLKLLPIVMT